MRNKTRIVFIGMGCLAMAVIYFATRGEAVCLGKVDRTRGSVRSVQIISCDLKKNETSASPVLSLDFEAVMSEYLPGFPSLPREAFGHPLGNNLGPEYVLRL